MIFKMIMVIIDDGYDEDDDGKYGDYDYDDDDDGYDKDGYDND